MMRNKINIDLRKWKCLPCFEFTLNECAGPQIGRIHRPPASHRRPESGTRHGRVHLILLGQAPLARYFNGLPHQE